MKLNIFKRVEEIIKDSLLYIYTIGESDDEYANKIVDEVAQALYQLYLEGFREIIGEVIYDLRQYENMHITKTDNDWIDELEEIWREKLKK